MGRSPRQSRHVMVVAERKKGQKGMMVPYLALVGLEVNPPALASLVLGLQDCITTLERGTLKLCRWAEITGLGKAKADRMVASRTV